ncbi:MAG: TIGR02186 family protein [Alkalilacustris sp.]
MLWLSVVWLCLAVPPSRADEVVLAGLSQSSVALTATFGGSEILVYGAIRRDTPLPADAAPAQVIVTVEGPPQRLSVWRKGRRGGIWMNVEEVRIARAPSFYAVASSVALDGALSATEDLRHSVSIPRAIRSFGTMAMAEDAPRFVEALIRLRSAAGMFHAAPGTVDVRQDTLFSTTVALPANLAAGSYRVRIILTRGGQVLDIHETAIEVRQAGLELWLSSLSRDQPLVYGLLAVALAVAAGWGASAAFRLLQR